MNQDLLGTQGITESNMFIYMGMVEQKINETLQAYAYVKHQLGQPIYNSTEQQEYNMDQFVDKSNSANISHKHIPMKKPESRTSSKSTSKAVHQIVGDDKEEDEEGKGKKGKRES